MHNRFNALMVCTALLTCGCVATQESRRDAADENAWPMSGGPNGTWRVSTAAHVPTAWSVRRGENIKWKTALPEGGQSGIAVWGDRLFLTINPPLDTPALADLPAEFAADTKKTGKHGTDIVLMCLNADTGAILWSRPVKGLTPSGYHYGFSDSTTPCPMTDGEHVWAINASGGMACFTVDGEAVWQRTWTPTGGRPFNKQFDSILYGGWVLNVEPPAKDDATRNAEWNYLHAFDQATGERVWVTQDAITHYNAPVLGETRDGQPAVLIGRGGPHGVPERPVGLSLISLAPGDAGAALWRWEPEDDNKTSGWGALSTQHWDGDKASWFYKDRDHLTIDATTGALIARQTLSPDEQRVYDPARGAYVLHKNPQLKKLEPQRHCNLSVGDHVYSMVRYQPFLARHHVVTGKTENLEVPREIDAEGEFIWKTEQGHDGLNARGQRHAADKRTLGGGFQKCFLGSPTMVNNLIYFTNAVGMVYVVDAHAEVFDASALIAVNDLGQRGETWTVNSLSYANGRLYHRTMKEVICIGK